MDKKPKLQKEFDRKKNIKKFKEKKKKMSADVAMYLEHGEDFPGFDQARRIRGGLAGGGVSQRGLGRAFKKGGKV